MAKKIVLSDENTKKMNALSKQYNDDYNGEYQAFKKAVKSIDEKFETDITAIFQLL